MTSRRLEAGPLHRQVLGSGWIAAIVAGLWSCHSEDLPIAAFTPHTEPNNLTVRFDANASMSRIDPSPTGVSHALEYLWDFGDGNSWDCQDCRCADLCRRDDPVVPYTFAQPGRYRVVLTVKDRNNSTDSTSQMVHPGNKRPTACFDAIPPEARPGDLIKFDGGCSTDDGRVVKWDFSFSDGTDPPPSDIAIVEHAFEEDNNYHVRLVVIDDDNVESPATTKVIPIASQPVVRITSPADEEPVSEEVKIRVFVQGGVVRVEYRVDGRPLDESDTPPFAVTWDSRSVRNGRHTITAKGFTNREIASAPFEITVDVQN